MKEKIKKLFIMAVPTMATLAIAIAKITAILPCHGNLNEPEMPKSLMK